MKTLDNLLLMLPMALLIALIGCMPSADTPMQKQLPVESQRIQITRIGVIEDDLAYHERRGIYIIKDTQTGAEYIGVSGVGISELGSHTEKRGKNNVTITDER